MRVLHISDLHFGRFFLPEVARALAAQAAEVRPDAIVVSGDLSQRARSSEFAQAAQYLDGLPQVPLLVVPGNHDVPLFRLHERVLSPLKAYREHFGAALTRLEAPTAVLVGLDSTAPLRALVNGRVNTQQLELCEQAFADAPEGAWRIVVLHHHLLPPPGYERRRPMPKSSRLLDAMQDLRVDVVLSGHLHRAYVGNTLDVHPGRGREEGIIVIQCGTSTSRRGRGYEKEKNSFNVIDLGADQLEVAHWMYFQKAGDFVRVSEHRFGRAPA